VVLDKSSRDWSEPELAGDDEGARLVARFEFDRAPLLTAFPFRHRVEIEFRISRGELRVRTTLTATGAEPVADRGDEFAAWPGRGAGWVPPGGSRSASFAIACSIDA
jgi:hypothetical protein